MQHCFKYFPLILLLLGASLGIAQTPAVLPKAITVPRAPDRDRNGGRDWPEVPASEAEKMLPAIPAKPLATPQKPRKLLVFYRADGYPHSSIPHWNKLIELLGKKTGAFEVTLSQKYEDLEWERLQQYDAVFFNNTCRMQTPEGVKVALQRFVREGKGFAGNHGSGDNWHDWAEGTEMLGAEFINHPYGRIQIKIDDPASPLTSMFAGQPYPFSDEIYAFKAPYSREKLRVLLSIDYPNSPDVAKAEQTIKARAAAPDARQVDKDWVIAAREDHDYPIAWIRPWGNGRVFYCSLGHRAEVTFDPKMVPFFLAGIQYALGDLKADDTPIPAKAPEQSKPAASASLLPQPKTDHKILEHVKFAEDLDVSIFATPPLMHSPVFLSTAPDGTLFVTSDPNGSTRGASGRGRVLRLRDSNHDGQADEVVEVVKSIDSPRGLVAHGNTVFVMHPPHLSAFIDTNGDGVADEQKILVQNIGWSLDKRAADHASNGIELGIDGWLYAAIGDFGFMQAEGTDGRKLQLRGGGIVRVRTDGTGLEIYGHNTRNVLEAAISPLLDGFARDNTNDGGGWNTRFHHFSGLEDHGYPRLYKIFAEEIVAPIADYGGGSGCGATWMGEPGWPAHWSNRPLEADWGKQFVVGHTLQQKGATYVETEAPRDLATLKSEVTYVNAFRPTDLDIDALGRLYLASWRDGGFGGNEKCGVLFRLQPRDYQSPKLPNFDTLSGLELVQLLASASHRTRMEAQRRIIRAEQTKETTEAMMKLAGDKSALLESRVAAIFTLRQALSERSIPLLETLANDASIQAWVVRAVTDDIRTAAKVPDDLLLQALKAESARTRKEAIIGIARLGKQNLAQAVTELLGNLDPLVTHTAIRGLILLGAADACFVVLDNAASPPTQQLDAARVLQCLHQESVIAGLTVRLEQEAKRETRRCLLLALCRLFNREAEWQGDSWGTVPDRRGPYFQPEPWTESTRIGAALAQQIKQLPIEETIWLAAELSRNRVASPEVIDRLLARAEQEPKLLEPLMGQLAELEEIPEAAIPFLIRLATAPETSKDARAHAMASLSRVNRREALAAILMASSLSNGGDFYHPARKQFLASPYLQQHYALLIDTAENNRRGAQFSEQAIMMLLANFGVAPEAHEAAWKSVHLGWQDSQRQLRILSAATETNTMAIAKIVAPVVSHTDPKLSEKAKHYFQVMGLDPQQILKDQASGELIDQRDKTLVVEEILKRKGNRNFGEKLFQQLGCIACHSTKPEQALKGPFLGNTANIYKRKELAIAVLEPAKTIAQGFATNSFVLENGRILSGFVVREAGDKVVIRNAQGQELTLVKSEIEERHVQEGVSLMPTGLVDKITLEEFASLITFVESLASNPHKP